MCSISNATTTLHVHRGPGVFMPPWGMGPGPMPPPRGGGSGVWHRGGRRGGGRGGSGSATRHSQQHSIGMTILGLGLWVWVWFCDVYVCSLVHACCSSDANVRVY